MGNIGRQTVATKAIDDLMQAEKVRFSVFLEEAVGKFIRNDWGDSLEDSVEMNNAVVQGLHQDRLFAVYNLPIELEILSGEKAIWIITEWDKSVTTILFPSDY